MNNNCIFCKIIKGEIPADKFYEDDNFLVILDAGPVSPGHSLIIPKSHFVNIFDAPEEALVKIGPITQKISQAIKKSVKADGLNIHINNDKEAGQVVFHAHIHLIPRFQGDNLVQWKSKENRDRDYFEETKAKILSELPI